MLVVHECTVCRQKSRETARAMTSIVFSCYMKAHLYTYNRMFVLHGLFYNLATPTSDRVRVRVLEISRVFGSSVHILCHFVFWNPNSPCRPSQAVVLATSVCVDSDMYYIITP